MPVYKLQSDSGGDDDGGMTKDNSEINDYDKTIRICSLRHDDLGDHRS